MGGAVVALDVPAAGHVDRPEYRGGLELLAEGPADDRPPFPLAHLVDGHDPTLAADESGVAHLPARFGVERILLQQQLDPLRR